MVQVFEAMCEHIDQENFVEFAYPSLERIAKEIKARHPDIPLLGFARDAPYGLEYLQRAGYDVMTVDAVIGGDVARDQLAAGTLTCATHDVHTTHLKPPQNSHLSLFVCFVIISISPSHHNVW